MFSIFKRTGKYTVPSLGPVDSAISGRKKKGRKTAEEKAEEAAEKLRLAKKNGTEKMLPKDPAPTGNTKTDSNSPEAAGTVPPK